MEKRSKIVAKHLTAKDYFGICFALAIVALVMFGRWYFQKEGLVKEEVNAEETDAISASASTEISDADALPSRLFFLRPTQVSFDQDLDVRVILSELMFIPCQTEQACRFREFRAGIIVSVISDPQSTTRLLFENFPSEQVAFGKRFRILDASQELVRLLVVDAAGEESVSVDPAAASQNFVITVDDTEVIAAPSE